MPRQQHRRSRLDRLFGGQPGAAHRVLESMQKTYGRQEGQIVFDATVLKRQRREKKGRRR